MKKTPIILASLLMALPLGVMARSQVVVSPDKVPAIISLQKLDEMNYEGKVLSSPEDYTYSVQLSQDKKSADVLYTFRNDYSGRAVKSYVLGSYWPYTDEVDDWAHYSVAYIYDLGMMKSYEDGAFHKEDPISRAMATTILYRMSGSDASTAQNPFSDVSADSYFAKPAIWAYKNGIVGGFDDGYGLMHFRADDNLARQEIAQMFYRYAGSPAVNVSQLDGVADSNLIGQDAKAAMAWCMENGIITGATNEYGTYLRPADTCSRQELATILQRYNELVR